MLVNIVRGTRSEHSRLFVAGIAFIAVLASLVGLSIAIYNKTFTDKTSVTVQAERAGLQLAKFGDVRLHGALVGYVDRIASDGERAVITLALRPEAAKAIPDNISVQILPTTLFGQNYVDLRPAEEGGPAASGPLRDGSVIPADRVTTNVDLQTVLADLYPVLRSIRPEDLNATLYALAHALQGKGEQIGQTFETLNDYLGTLNAELPTLETDLRLLARVAKDYELASPDIIRILRNATVTARTVHQKRDDVEQALHGLTGMSKVTRVTLAENEKNLKAMTRSARPLLALLDTYSPEVPCLLTGLDRQRENTKKVFAPNIIHQTLEFGAPQRTSYTAEDAPVYGEVGHGPWCLTLPDTPYSPTNPAPFLPLKDGTDKDNPDGGMG